MTQLTEHFSLAELTASTTANKLSIDNTPGPEALAQLQRTAEMLERIRSTLGVPIKINSGYRSLLLNKAVGGVPTSDHSRGMAADFVAPGYGTPYDIAKALAPLVSVLGIGQLIHEFGQWVHVSTRVPGSPANRVITISSAGTELGVQEVA
ncbi:MAG: D-Ala-D-Ala carboxypeptidase family metallohydrolase [Burkholderiales bacterium]